jgi:hypothetical protein
MTDPNQTANDAVDRITVDLLTAIGEAYGHGASRGDSLLVKLRDTARPSFFNVDDCRTPASATGLWLASCQATYLVGYAAGMVQAGSDTDSPVVRGVRAGTSSSKALGLSGKSDEVTSAVNKAKANWAMAALRAGLMTPRAKSGAATPDTASAEPATPDTATPDLLPATITTKVDAVTLQGFHWIASDPLVQARFRQWLGAQPDYAVFCGI